MTKALYKPAGMLVSVPGGMLAGAIFKRVRKIAAHEDKAPKAADAQRSWREVRPGRRAAGRGLHPGQDRGGPRRPQAVFLQLPEPRIAHAPMCHQHMISPDA
jgi:hypothetical protein